MVKFFVNISQTSYHSSTASAQKRLAALPGDQSASTTSTHDVIVGGGLIRLLRLHSFASFHRGFIRFFGWPHRKKNPSAGQNLRCDEPTFPESDSQWKDQQQKVSSAEVVLAEFYPTKEDDESLISEETKRFWSERKFLE